MKEDKYLQVSFKGNAVEELLTVGINGLDALQFADG